MNPEKRNELYSTEDFIWWFIGVYFLMWWITPPNCPECKSNFVIDNRGLIHRYESISCGINLHYYRLHKK